MFWNVCCVGVAVKDWSASGERGGDRMGRFEMGEGGTKGKAPKTESVSETPVAAVATDEDEILRSRLNP